MKNKEQQNKEQQIPVDILRDVVSEFLSLVKYGLIADKVWICWVNELFVSIGILEMFQLVSFLWHVIYFSQI